MLLVWKLFFFIVGLLLRRVTWLVNFVHHLRLFAPPSSLVEASKITYEGVGRGSLAFRPPFLRMKRIESIRIEGSVRLLLFIFLPQSLWHRRLYDRVSASVRLSNPP